MARPSVVIARARGVVRDPHSRIRVVTAMVFLAIAFAVLLIGGVQ